MASLASVDRLNILYYGEMELPAAEKKLRIVMAGAFRDVVKKYYDTVHAIIADEKTDKRRKDILLAAAAVSLRKAYLGFFDKYYERYVSAIFQGGEPYYGVGAWRNQHAFDFAVWLTRTARDEPNIAFENSHSMTVTRTEINAMCNLAALDGAYRSGMRFKTWETFGDGKVRPSHKAVGGTRIPIDEPFTVGSSKLMFPNDTSLGADAEEIVNCRCTLKFDRGTPLTNANNRGIMRVGSGRMGTVRGMTDEKDAISAQSVLNQKKTEDIIKRAVAQEKTIFDDGLLGKRAKFFEPDDGYFDITMHGEEKLAYFYGEKIDSHTLAQIIMQRKDYHGEPVRLLSCNTGITDENGDSFAQRLANELNVPVKAPNNFLWAHRVVNGISKITIGSTAYANDGEFIVFEPKLK